MDRAERLGRLASDILDGRSIDWDAAQSTADSSDTPVLEQLQVLAEIAALHRQLSDTPATWDEARRQTGTPATWGHLRILERVGSGTFGEVFRAWDTHLDREVALKLLRATPVPGDAAASLSDPTRIVNEGRLLARVRHPHVITVYGAEPRDGSVGVWMEFIRGRTLQQIVDEQGPMSAREAVAVGTDLCRALAAVHAAGLLHRDVTARNVMREEGGRLVLMDFGTGREQLPGDTVTVGRDVAGTPAYMAPELFAGHPADRRTDIYALGVLLFYLVTGRFPVTGRSLAEIGEAHARGQRTRLREARPELPAGFVRTVEHALAVEPAQRISSVSEFETALERALDERTARTHSGRRRPWAIAGAAATAAVLVVVAGVWSVGGPRTVVSAPPATRASNAAGGLVVRQLRDLPNGFWPFSNPSDDGRFMAGMMTETGDAGIVDLLTGEYRALGMLEGDGYASVGALSPDGSWIAVDWHEQSGDALRIVRRDGSGLRTLIPKPANVAVHGWSRDNSLILTVIEPQPGERTIALVAASDGAVRPLARLGAHSPEAMSLSPDGRYVAYDYPEGDDAADRDVFVLDAHTGATWTLAPSAGQDSSPFWSPDGRTVVFVSDRSRIPSLWRVPVEHGRSVGEPQLVRDNIGRVWLRGFTADGVLHYHEWAGYAEVYVASLDAPAQTRKPLSPRQALSNFYPEWSPDGCCVAYSSERGVGSGRDLWVFDTRSGQEVRVPVPVAIGRPFGWSPDSTQILAGHDAGILIVTRATGEVRAVADEVTEPAWGPAGIVYAKPKQIVVYDPTNGRVARTLDFNDPSVTGFHGSRDGRSVMAMHRDGRVVLHELQSRRTYEWHDTAGAKLQRFQGRHVMAPHALGVAYAVIRPGLNGETMSLMFWGGSGTPRELLRVTEPERLLVAGWYGDGLSLLAVRWTVPPVGSTATPGPRTLWRIPITGGSPVSTGLVMDALRDFSIHRDGRQVAFNAGFKQSALWVMENLLPATPARHAVR